MKKKKVQPITKRFTLPRNPKGAQSVKDIVKETGMSDTWVKDYLRGKHDEGSLRCGRRREKRIDGAFSPIPVYWVED